MTTTRAVCLRGHVVSDLVYDREKRLEGYGTMHHENPLQPLPNFCDVCGTAVLVDCPTCDGPLMPRLYGEWVNPLSSGGTRAMSFCKHCGSPLPWATREERLAQLVTYVEGGGLDEATKLAAIEEVGELVGTDPEDEDAQVEAAEAVRSRVGAETWKVMLPVLQTVVTEAVKRRLGLV